MKRIRKKIFNPGIYKITNPLGEVYIGQTINLDRRWREYERYAQGREDGPPEITASLILHGFESHSFEVIYKLPKDVSREVLKNYEYFVYIQYSEAGVKLMNLAECGTGVIVSEKTKKLMSENAKEMWTPEFRENHIKKRIGKAIHSEEEKKKRSIWLKENRNKWDIYKFSAEDTLKGQQALKKKMEEVGYIRHPEEFEKWRQDKSKIILNTQTGIFYFGCREAAISINHTEDNLRKKLKGQYKNNTPLIFV